MTETDTQKSAATRESEARLVSFFDHHVPPMMSGNYRIEAGQTISSSDPGKPIAVAVAGFGVIRVAGTSLANLPASGTSVIYAATGPGGACFRIFDAAGGVAREAGPAELSARAGDLPALTQRIEKLPLGGTGATGADVALASDIAAILGLRTSVSRAFTVGGERYALNPQSVLSVFPPANSLGDHSNVLPHVMLDRATLPWEREATHDANRDKLTDTPFPWMALLLFDNEPGSNAPVPKTITLGPPPGESQTPDPKDDTLYRNRAVSFLPRGVLESEGGETPDQPVTIIDIPWSQLGPLLPRAADLPFLTHVRKRSAGFNDNSGVERAVIIGNRLPTRGHQSIAFLVSLEHRYSNGEFWTDPALRSANPTEFPVRLVVLKSWRFGCLDEASFMITRAVIDAAGDSISAAARGYFATGGAGAALFGKKQVPESKFRAALSGLDDPDDLDALVKVAKSASLNFRSLLMHLDQGMLTLPLPDAPISEKLRATLAQGALPLKIGLRNGTRSLAWYRGPLAPRDHDTIAFAPHARAADHLLRYNDDLKMYDTSYSAAWELGRLLMLADKPTSLALYRWKRAHAHYRKASERLDHLPFSHLPGALDLPDILAEWFYDSALLKGVPFDYLVPDPAMLPRESIRMFQLDQHWIECLLDGAFGIGRMNENDVLHDATLQAEAGSPLDQALGGSGRAWPSDGASGVLIRSDVVAGWPDLKVDAVAFIDDDDAAAAGTSIAMFERDLSRDVPLTGTAYACLDALKMGLPPAGAIHSHPVKTTGAAGEAVAWLVTDKDDIALCHIERALDGSGKLDVTLPHLRHDRLSDNVLICIFHGQAEAISIHLKPEAIHFGISEPDGVRHLTRFKKLRHPDGVEDDDLLVKEIPETGAEGVLDIATLAARIEARLKQADQLPTGGTLTSGGFALQMVEGVDRVRYFLKP